MGFGIRSRRWGDRRFGGAGQRGDRTRAHVLAGALACRHRTRGPDDSVPQQDVSSILRAPSSVSTKLERPRWSNELPIDDVRDRTGDVLLGAILRGPALRVVDDERVRTVGRKYSIRPSSDKGGGRALR